MGSADENHSKAHYYNKRSYHWPAELRLVLLGNLTPKRTNMQ